MYFPTTWKFGISGGVEPPPPRYATGLVVPDSLPCSVSIRYAFSRIVDQSSHIWAVSGVFFDNSAPLQFATAINRRQTTPTVIAAQRGTLLPIAPSGLIQQRQLFSRSVLVLAWYKRALRSSGMLRDVNTDVSGRHIRLIFKGETVTLKGHAFRPRMLGP
jgi:hypothetical protein